MTRRIIGFEPLVLPARGFRAGMGLHGSAPHSRGAKRRENAKMSPALLSAGLDLLVGIFFLLLSLDHGISGSFSLHFYPSTERDYEYFKKKDYTSWFEAAPLAA